MAFRYWLTRPRLLTARIHYWFWEKLNPDKPWLCPGTVRFCQTTLSQSMTALEFGSGRSTRWFSSLVGKLTSVEHAERWHTQVKAELQQAGIVNVDYRHVPLSHPISDAEQATYDDVPGYVAICDEFADQSLDFVVVDGHYRGNCIRRVIPKVASGGYLLLDDADRWPSLTELGIPKTWRIADDSTNGLKRCLIWQAP